MGFLDRLKDMLNNNSNNNNNNNNNVIEEPITTNEETVTANEGTIISNEETTQNADLVSVNPNPNILHILPENEDVSIKIKTKDDTFVKTFYIDVNDHDNLDGESIEVFNQKSNSIVFSSDGDLSFKNFGHSDELNFFSYQKHYDEDVYLSIEADDLSLSRPVVTFTLHADNRELSFVPQSLIDDEFHLNDLGQIVQAVEKEAFQIYKDGRKEFAVEIPNDYAKQMGIHLSSNQKDGIYLFNFESPSVLINQFDRLEQLEDSYLLVYPKSFIPCKEFEIVENWVNSPDREKHQKMLEELDANQLLWESVPRKFAFSSKEFSEILSSCEKELVNSFKKTNDDEYDEALKVFNGATELNFKVESKIDYIKQIEGKCKFALMRMHVLKGSDGTFLKELECIPSTEKPQLTLTLDDGTTHFYEFSAFSTFSNVLRGLDTNSELSNYVKKALVKECETSISVEDKSSIKYAIGNDGRGAIVFPGLNEGFKSRIICNHIEREQDGSLKVTIPIFPPQQVSVHKSIDYTGKIRVMNLDDFNNLMDLNKQNLEKVNNKVNLRVNEKNYEIKEVEKDRI